jgi:hypothetical protein
VAADDRSPAPTIEEWIGGNKERTRSQIAHCRLKVLPIKNMTWL